MTVPSLPRLMMRADLVGYKLTPDHQVVPCTLIESAQLVESCPADYRIGQDYVDETEIVTDFIGIDLSLGWQRLQGPRSETPLPFETMVFGGPLNGCQNRYATWNEAVTGHKAMVDRVRTEQPAE